MRRGAAGHRQHDEQLWRETAWVAIDDIAFDGSGAPDRALTTHFTLRCSGSTRDVAIAAMLDSSVAEPAHRHHAHGHALGHRVHRAGRRAPRDDHEPLRRVAARAERHDEHDRIRCGAPITARM